MEYDELSYALNNEVNSAMLTCENHDADNGFISGSIIELRKGLKRRGYEPVGICDNVPYNKYSTPQVAFVYRFMDEIHWCHMPLVCLRSCKEQLLR